MYRTTHYHASCVANRACCAGFRVLRFPVEAVELARGIELDWVVVRITAVRRLAAVAAVAVVTGALLFVAYGRLNLPPDVRALRAIERAERLRDELAAQPIPSSWERELEQADGQLAVARKAYTAEGWSEAQQNAEDARQRFEALLGAGASQMVGVGQFFSLEGRVQVQRSGQGDWEPAHQRMPLFNGDFVRTGRDGSAEILFADGAYYRIAPGSLLEIHHRGPTGDEGQGAVRMVVGRLNVYTSSSPSTVATEGAETEIDRASRVEVDVDQDDQGTRVAAFQGRAVVRGSAGSTVEVGARQMVAATAAGALTDRSTIPRPPVTLGPTNNAGFELSRDRVVELSWRRAGAASAIHLQVSRSKHFFTDVLDIDAPGLERDSARLRPVHPGTYFWRVATVESPTVRSEWSPAQRFRVLSAARARTTEDTVPPMLEVAPPQQLGHMFIVEGRTEADAVVDINGEGVATDGEGRFRKALELRSEGWNDLVISAVDPAGNRTEHRERVFVEVY